jgi:hypothetical protein
VLIHAPRPDHNPIYEVLNMARPRVSTYQSTTQIGDVFGKLTVIGTAEPYGKKKSTRWRCRCECGNETTPHQSALRQGVAKSCGCTARTKWIATITTHGLTKTPEYKNWAAMKARCYNANGPKFADYGGRGIKVCNRWLDSFENFLADMGKRPEGMREIDRIDPNGDYTPENCRWANRSQQNRNRRDSLLITMNGETKCLADWCDDLDLPYSTISTRIHAYKWDPIRALTERIGKYRRTQAYTHSESGALAEAVRTLDNNVQETEGIQ